MISPAGTWNVPVLTSIAVSPTTTLGSCGPAGAASLLHPATPITRTRTRDRLMAADRSKGYATRAILQFPDLAPAPATSQASVAVHAATDRDAPAQDRVVVGHEGLEPSANGLRVRCSTN